MSVDDEIAAILMDFPEAKGFEDLITASDIDGFRDVAEQIALKVRKTKSAGSNNQPSTTPKPEKTKAVSVAEAISAKNWPDYLAAKWEEAGHA